MTPMAYHIGLGSYIHASLNKRPARLATRGIPPAVLRRSFPFALWCVRADGDSKAVHASCTTSHTVCVRRHRGCVRCAAAYAPWCGSRRTACCGFRCTACCDSNTRAPCGASSTQPALFTPVMPYGNPQWPVTEPEAPKPLFQLLPGPAMPISPVAMLQSLPLFLLLFRWSRMRRTSCWRRRLPLLGCRAW